MVIVISVAVLTGSTLLLETSYTSIFLKMKLNSCNGNPTVGLSKPIISIGSKTLNAEYVYQTLTLFVGMFIFS